MADLTLQADEKRDAIAQRLRAAREAAGLSQGQVSRLMNIRRPSISEIEAGKRRVSAEELAGFAKHYHVSMEWLSCSDSEEIDPTEDRLMLAARELSKLKPEDLSRLLAFLKSMPGGDPTE
jgi:transcriptional regulator with XRE-family HTH domain